VSHVLACSDTGSEFSASLLGSRSGSLNTPMFGSRTPALGMQTPAYGSQTPAYGSQTPRLGDATPSSSAMYGSQTPAYDAGNRTPSSSAWNPLVHNTPHPYVTCNCAILGEVRIDMRSWTGREDSSGGWEEDDSSSVRECTQRMRSCPLMCGYGRTWSSLLLGLRWCRHREFAATGRSRPTRIRVSRLAVLLELRVHLVDRVLP
jgi:hypothetical protein